MISILLNLLGYLLLLRMCPVLSLSVFHVSLRQISILLLLDGAFYNVKELKMIDNVT